LSGIFHGPTGEHLPLFLNITRNHLGTCIGLDIPGMGVSVVVVVVERS
jgi:hypothetical protein